MSYERINWEDSPSVKTPISAENLRHMEDGIKSAHELAENKIPNSQKGQAGGVPTLDNSGKIPVEQLPERGIKLGETSDTAFRGDYGKVAYDHAVSKGNKFESGLYKITTNEEGHVVSATPVTAGDITRLGIPDANTTYGAGGDELGLVKNGGNVVINADGTMTAPAGGGEGGTVVYAKPFIATYGVTPFADMMNAWREGNDVILQGDVANALSVRQLIHVSPTKLFFGRVLAESQTVEEVIITSDNQWTLISNKYSPYIATYGVTTFNDMRNAWRQGKDVILKGDNESALTIRTLVHITSTKIFFGRVLAESQTVEEVVVTSDNQWSLISNKYVTPETLDEKLDGYISASTLIQYVREDELESYVRGHPTAFIKNLRAREAGTISWFYPESTYLIYCPDGEATLTAWGEDNGNVTLSGKMLTVYIGGSSQTLRVDDEGTVIESMHGNQSAWLAVAADTGLAALSGVQVRRGVIGTGANTFNEIEVSYPAGCNIIVTGSSGNGIFDK
jgi:hypothetical protein